jgi:serine/threonine protein kinase
MASQNSTSIDNLKSREQFGQYMLLERIAVGGEATIWTAWDDQLGQVNAIKMAPVLASSARNDADQEFQIVSQLNHPLVIRIYDSGLIDNVRYLTMPYFSYGSLGDLLDHGKLSPHKTFTLVRHLVEALGYIHSQGVVHRDLKPTNILLDSAQRAYLSDFGIARIVSTSTAVLHTGRGTAPYSPPEQHTKYPITNQSDIYSLGVIIYQMLTGQLPWDGDAALAIMQLSEEKELPDPRDQAPDLPENIGDVLRRMTALNPQDRPATVSEAWQLVTEPFGSEIASISILLPDEIEQVQRQDAERRISIFMNAWNNSEQPFAISLTDFALFHSIYSQSQQHPVDVAADIYQFLLYEAVVHDFALKYWWHKEVDSAIRLSICAQIVEIGGPDLVTRILTRMVDEPALVFSKGAVPPSSIMFLVDLIESEHARLVLTLLEHGLKPADRWQSAIFSILDDLRLAKVALGDKPYGTLAAQLIGRIKSETAAQEIASHPDEMKAINTLIIIRQAAGSLPTSLPFSLRLRSWILLMRRQLFENPGRLLRSYLGAAAGYGLALGLYIFVFYRWTSLLDNSRILNAVGNGLVFGPVMGLGAFLARLLPRRLRVIPSGGRILLGGVLGALLLNLGIVGFHEFFLNSTPEGYTIAAMSIMMTLTISIAEILFKSQIWRSLSCILITALTIGFSWQTYLKSGSSPMLYFDVGQPIQTIFLILVTSALMGSFLYIVRDPV